MMKNGWKGFRRASRLLRRFAADENGNFMLVFALLLVPLILFAGGAIDFSTVFERKSNYQAQLDSVAIAAGNLFIQYKDDPQSAQKKQIEKFLTARLAEIAVGEAGEKFTYRYKINVEKRRIDIKGKLTKETGLLQAGNINKMAAAIQSSVVTKIESKPVCILALGQRTAKGIEFVGDGEMKAKDCVVWSNAAGPQSITFDGSGKVDAERICAVGRVGWSGQYKTKPQPEDNCNNVEDPLKFWQGPAVGATCDYTHTDWIKGDVTRLSPGTYCGGLRVDARKIKLTKGIYIIKDGPLILRGESSIQGENVSFYLTGTNTYADIDGKAKVDIRAPKSGLMSGIAIAANRNTVLSGTSIINGRTDLKIGGVLYFPNQYLHYLGESDTTAASPVTTIIADAVELGGKAYLEVKNDRKKAKYAPIIETNSGTVSLVK